MIVVKKRVSLDFLGEEYSDSYLIFNSISLRELPEIQKKFKSVQGDNQKSMEAFKEVLTKRFISGQIQQDGKAQEVVAEDLPDLPIEAILTAIERLVGTPDPKS